MVHEKETYLAADDISTLALEILGTEQISKRKKTRMEEATKEKQKKQR